MTKLDDTPLGQLRYVANISWPRSGHHMLVGLCRNYFGSDFHYCEFYNKDIDCCRKFPCARQNKIVMSKNHDHKLDILLDDASPILIQIRSFKPSVVSNYELAVKNGREDSFKSFVNFATHYQNQYKPFYKKWITSDFDNERLIVRYEDITKNPETIFSDVLRFIAPGIVVDVNRVQEAIENVNKVTVEKSVPIVQKNRV